MFLPQVAEETIYFPLFAEQSFFHIDQIPSHPQESNGRPLTFSFVSPNDTTKIMLLIRLIHEFVSCSDLEVFQFWFTKSYSNQP